MEYGKFTYIYIKGWITMNRISLHNINLETEVAESREINDTDAIEYVNQLKNEVLRNNAKREYLTIDETTQVFNNVSSIVDNNSIGSQGQVIADRLLRNEVEAQRAIEQLNVTLKKGSLIQALFSNESSLENSNESNDNQPSELYYLISKVDSDDFLDDRDLTKTSGLRYNEKAYRNCLFIFNSDKTLKQIYISDDNVRGTKYWHYDFLELQPVRDDKYNTENVYTIAKRSINSLYRDDSSSKTLYSNNLLGYFTNMENFDLNSLSQYVFGDTNTDNSSNFQADFNRRVEQLSVEKQVDTQFTIDEKSIPTRYTKEKYDATSNITILINGFDDSLKNNIVSKDNSEFGKHIIIKNPNQETFDAFDWN